MWPLHLTRVAVFEKRFETATKSQILAFLQDSEQELRLSPVVTKVEQDQNDPAWFTVTDSLPMMWGIKTTTTFRCYSEKVDLEQEQGTNNVVWAGMGTWLRCERRVEERDAPPGAASSQKEVWIREKVVVKGLLFLMPYIYRTMVKTHEVTLNLIEPRALKQYYASQEFLA
ncbi:hypothetical protein BJ165DRAFT_1606434 [Panaeolus papilionaceus]|nr:hypothetical protein BJ165DRAFT_1606434 [Panaeolus papilionaceus]